MTDPKFREGAVALAEKGRTPDTMASFPQLPEVTGFALALPDLTIILNHIGGGNRIGIYAGRDEEVAAEWRDGIAACPNMEVKLGGMGMPRWGFGWHVRDVPVGSETLEESMSPWMT